MIIYPAYSHKALSGFFEQLLDLLLSGVNLNRALMIIYELEPNSRRKFIIGDIIEQIHLGKDLSAALAMHHNTFPPEISELIKAGEISGTLNMVIKKIITLRNTVSQIKSSFTKALSYPLILLIVAVIVMALLLIMVIPQFAGMFAKFNAPLPPLTKFLLRASELIQNYAIFILSTLVAFGFIIKLTSMASKKFKLYLGCLVFKIPVLGKILLDFNQAKFFSVLELLLTADIKILSALNISSNAMRNLYFAKMIKSVIPDIQSGVNVAKVLGGLKFISGYARPMLAIGEETGNMAASFSKIAEYHQKRIDVFTDRLKIYLEPGLIIFVSLFIGVILFGMYQPIFKLNQLF